MTAKDDRVAVFGSRWGMMGGSTPVPDLVLEDGGIFLVTKSPSTWNGPRFFVDGWLPFFFPLEMRTLAARIDWRVLGLAGMDATFPLFASTKCVKGESNQQAPSCCGTRKRGFLDSIQLRAFRPEQIGFRRKYLNVARKVAGNVLLFCFSFVTLTTF